MNSFYKEQIEKVLKDERCAMTINQLARKTGLPQGDIAKVLNKMVDDELVSVCDGYYSWTEGEKSEKAEYVPNVAPSECPDATPPVSSLTCTVCGKVCANPRGLGNHMTCTHGPKAKKNPKLEHTPLEHVCTICGAGNRSQAALEKHRTNKHPDSMHRKVCPKMSCGPEPSLAEQLRPVHKPTATIPTAPLTIPDYVLEAAPTIIETLAEISRVPCPYCDRLMKNERSIQRHIIEVHRAAHEEAMRETLTCPDCHRLCRSEAELVKHRASHMHKHTPGWEKSKKARPTNASVTISEGEEGSTLIVTGRLSCFGESTCPRNDAHDCPARLNCTAEVLRREKEVLDARPKLFMAVDPEPPVERFTPDCYGKFADTSHCEESVGCKVAETCAAHHLMDDPLDAIYEIVARAREARKDGWILTADISINIDSKGESTMFTLSMDKVSQ